MRNLGKKAKYTYSFLRRRLVHLNLQILYQCNFRCTICDFWKESYTKMPMLPASEIAVMSEKLRSTGPLIVSLGGGEPLLHPDIVEIVHTLEKNHFPVMICNGWYVTPELARDLFKAGLYEISISLDYTDRQKHDRQRGAPGAFDRAVHALEILHKNRIRTHQRVHMISVVMDDNIEEIEPLIQLAHEIGVTYLVTLYSHGRGSKESRISRRDIGDYLLSLKRKYPNFIALRGYLARFTEAVTNNNGVIPCYAGKNLFNIDCQGNVTRCIDALDHVAGNMFNDDFAAIKRALLRQHEENDCGHCWTSCRGNIESLMYGGQRIMNMLDAYQITRSIPLSLSK